MPIRIVPDIKADDRHPRRKWITKKKKTPDNPRLKGGYDPQKQQDPKWITKKKPTNWITKKKKPTEWIKRKPPADIRKQLTDAFAGGIKGKPHSSPSGRVASVGRTIKRMADYKGGGRANFRRGGKGTGPTPGQRIKARKSRAEEWWTGKEGTHAVYNPTLDKKLREKRPHSSPEGRMRDVKAAYAKAAEKEKSARIRRKLRPMMGGRPAASTKKFTPIGPQHRTSKGVGGILKKIITKIKPKPPGVFKPKPVPKAVTDVDRPFKGYDKSYTRADDKKITSMLKKLGDEIKAQPLPPKLKKTLKKAQKAFPHKKAKGGPVRPIDIPWPKPENPVPSKKRVKKRHGGSPQSHYLQHGYGPHKIQLRSGKPKLAKKGW